MRKKTAKKNPSPKKAGNKHELHIHQVELEVQNAELLSTHSKLELSRNKYFDLFDFAPVSYLTLDEKGMILEANLTTSSLLGFERRFLIQQPFSRFVDAEQQNIYLSWLEKIFDERKKQVLELKLLKKDGSHIHARLEGVAFSDSLENQSQYRIAVIDITERKEEENLRDRLIQIGELAHGKLVFDEIMSDILPESAKALESETAAVSLCRQGQWVISHVHGFPEEVIGTKMNDEEERHAVLAIKSGKPVSIYDAFINKRVNNNHMKKWGVRSVMTVPFFGENEVEGVIFLNYHSRRHEFRQVHLDFAAQLSSILTLALRNAILYEKARADITERKQAEEALRKSERMLEKSQEIAHLGSWELDLVNNNLSWSDEAYRIFGCKPGEFGATYEAFLEIVHPDDRKAVDAAYSGSIREGRDFYEVEHRIIRKSTGEIRYVHEKCEHIRDKSGKIIRSLGMTHDITERKLAEEEVKKLAKFPDENPNPVLRVSNSGEIIYANQASQALLKNFGRRVGQNLPDEYQKAVSSTLKNRKPEEIEVSCYGHIYSLVIFPIVDQGYVNIYGRDITERKRAEEALQKASDRLEEKVRERTKQLVRTIQKLRDEIKQRKEIEKELLQSDRNIKRIFEESPLGAAIVSLDYKFQKVNPELCRITGYTEEEMLKLTFPKITHPDDIEKDIEQAESLKKGEIDQYYMDKRYIRKDKGIIWVRIFVRLVRDEAGNPLYFLPLIQDITERKQREEERLRLLSAIEHAGEGIMITDTKDIIQYVNPAMEKMSGYASKELRGWRADVLDDGGEISKSLESMRKSLEKSEAWAGRLTRKRKDNSTYEVAVTVSPVLDPSGSVINHVYTERNISEELKIEQATRQTQKMEALGTLASGIAHDFNNILLPIIMNAESLLMDAEEKSEEKKDLEEILKSAQRGSRLVRQISAFSRVEKAEKEPVKVSSLINENLKLIRASLPSSVKIKKSMRSKARILADPTQVHQIVMNLCVNASYAMREKGVMEVKTEDVNIDFIKAFFLHEDLGPGPYVKLSVSDSGRGIDPGIMDKIFDPFFTTKKPGEGTGMGLSVVHGIVKNHGGAITAESEPGKGSTFNVFLPAVKEEEKSQKTLPKNIPKGNERILLVDDEKAVLRSERKMLENLGYKITSKTDSREALEIFKKRQNAFDLVITDQTLPDFKGTELAREINRLKPDIPIILCAGTPPSIKKDEARRINIQKIILKPYSSRKLASAVREVLDKEK